MKNISRPKTKENLSRIRPSSDKKFDSISETNRTNP